MFVRLSASGHLVRLFVGGANSADGIVIFTCGGAVVVIVNIVLMSFFGSVFCQCQIVQCVSM